MNHSEQIDKLAEALAKAQGAFGPLLKDREVKAGQYSFRYATLDAVLSCVREPLAANGLSIMQAVSESGNGAAVDTQLTHSSGQWVRTCTPITIQKADNQGRGSAISYGRRYGLVALLALAADEDDDGNKGDGKDVDIKRIDRGPPSPPPPPTPKSPPGISDMRVKVNAACTEIDAAGDEDGVLAYLAMPATKKLAVEVCRDFPMLWEGTEPGSGLKGRVLVAGDQLDTKSMEAWCLKVEEAARK